MGSERHHWRVVWPWTSRGMAVGIWYCGAGCWTIWLGLVCLRRTVGPRPLRVRHGAPNARSY